MTEFDPSRPTLVHDGLNDKWFIWETRWAAKFKNRPRSDANPHLVRWDAQLLDGWLPMPSALAERLERYGFKGQGSSLVNSVEWRELKEAIAVLIRINAGAR